jgi:hypothetical protein
MNCLALEGQLGIRLATAEGIAERVASYLESVAAVDPLFSRWRPTAMLRHRSIVPATLTWPPDKAELRNWVNECANFESRNGKKQHVGFSIRTVTRENDPFSVDFWLSVDFTEGAWWFFNRVGLTFFAAAGNIWIALQHTGQDPIALSRRALVDLGTIWDCDWAGVQGGDYSAKGSRPPNAPRLTRYKSGWMVYLDRAHATRVGEAKDVEVERIANGAALFTTVADTTFDGGNADHMAAARRLQTALVPLNDQEDQAAG